MADVWRFVDSIASSPTVRLDLNDMAIWEVVDAELPPPEQRDTVSSSILIDGDHVPASAYGDRTVTLNLELVRDNQNLAATQRQLLTRELSRPTNILEYRPDGASASVFFRTKRSSPTPTRQPASKAYYTFETPIRAEPFALGLKETLSNITLAANPVTANGLNFTLAAASMKGDVETPLNLKFADFSKVNNQMMFIGVRRRGTVANMPYFFQCEAMTNGTATTDIAGGANFSPTAGTNATETTTAVSAGGLTPILTQAVPVSATKDARGQYRVFYRARVDDTNTIYEVGFAYEQFALPFETKEIDGADTVTHPAFQDLGVLTLPQTLDPVYDGPTGVELDVAPGDLKIMARDVIGTGNLESDFVILMPADDSCCLIDTTAAGGTASHNLYIDGYNRRAYIATSDTTIDHEIGIKMPTAFPMVTPNQDNRICVIPNARPDAGAAISTTFTVTPSYWPRYLDVRPATT